jgi:cell division protein FtsB
MEILTSGIIKYLRFFLVFFAVSSAGILMGEKTLIQKQKIEEKKAVLQKENKNLTQEIKKLERTATLMRTDQKTIEKAAKRKLGMSRPDEAVFIFERKNSAGLKADKLECGLGISAKMP